MAPQPVEMGQEPVGPDRAVAPGCDGGVDAGAGRVAQQQRRVGLPYFPAQPPVAVGHHRAAQSRHGERLGRRRHGHDPLRRPRDGQHGRERRRRVGVHEIGVDLVGHDVEVVGVGQLHDPRQDLGAGHPAGGVVGVAPQQHPGAGLPPYQRLQVVGVEGPAPVGVVAHEPLELRAPGRGTDLQEDVVDRRGQDHALARSGQGGDGRGDALEHVHTGVYEAGVGAPAVARPCPVGERLAHILLEVVVAEVSVVDGGLHGVGDSRRGTEVVLGHPRRQGLGAVLRPLGVAVAPLACDFAGGVEGIAAEAAASSHSPSS